MSATSRAVLGGDVRALTRMHSTELSEIDVMEKSIQDFAFSYNKEILQGRAEIALSILDGWQPLLFEDIKESAENLLPPGYIWLEDVLVSALMGWPPTLIETVSFYASDYPDGLRVDNLTVADKIGLELWALFASLPTSLSAALPNLASTTLLDDYHDVTLQRGTEFVLEAGQLLYEIGIISDKDIPGRNFVLLRESEMLKRSQAILHLLEKSGGEITFEDNTSRFVPAPDFWESAEMVSKSRRKQIRKQGVLLFEDNKPSCPLMDAASYLRPTNYHYLHVKMFPETYRSQQDDTYTLLHAAKIIPKGQYHNLFYQEDPAALLQIVELLRDGLRRIIEDQHTYLPWSSFDYPAYAKENYPKVQTRDKEIISFIQKELKDRLGKKPVSRAIDLGAGGNLYPGMLWTPYAQHIELWEYTEQGRNWLLDNMSDETWKPFADLISPNALQDLQEKSLVRYGSVSDLLPGTVEALSAFFVSEKITSHHVYLRMMIRRMVESLCEGGICVFAHSLNNRPHGSFPVVDITEDSLRKIYNSLPLQYTWKSWGSDYALPGSSRLAVLVGQKISGPLDTRGIFDE